MSDIDILLRLAVGLAVGLVIGFERGWNKRGAAEGTRVAGFRTFALFGLSGALAAILALADLPLVAASVAFGLVGLLLASHWIMRGDPDVGATTETASLATFALGALAGIGHFAPAISGAVVAALLLGAKPLLHGWLERIDQKELFAALQLLLISAVVLPLLPDQTMGPLDVINPYRLWWMVVLTAGLSFAGYISMRLVEARRAVLLTGFAGGLVASTATTFALARKAQGLAPALQGAVASAIMAAIFSMLVRTYILASVIHPPFWLALAWPMAAMAAASGLAALWFARTALVAQADARFMPASNPLDLRAALGFAVVLAVALVLIEGGRLLFGATGVYLLAALGGLGDVDAVTLSLAERAQTALPLDIAATALVLAALVNTAVKVVLAAVLGPAALARKVAVAVAIVLAAGVTAITDF